MHRRAVFALVVLLAACGGGSEAADPTTTTAESTTTTSTTLDPTNTTEAPSTTSFVESDVPPPLLLTGEDFDAIVRSIAAYSEWVAAHPDPALAANYAKSGSPAHEESTEFFQALLERGLHGEGDPGFVTTSRVLDRPGDSLVVVYVALVNPPFTLVRADGSVDESFEGNPETGFAWQLERQDDGRWLLIERTELGEV